MYECVGLYLNQPKGSRHIVSTDFQAVSLNVFNVQQTLTNSVISITFSLRTFVES